MSRWAGRFASTLLLALSLAGPARASPSRVVVVQSANESQIVNQATMRLRAELAASGFEVITIDRAPGASPREAVEDVGLHPVATLSIVSTEKGAAIDVWVADHLTGKTLVRRVDIDSQAAPAAPKVLAIRAVELLRASLLEAESAPPEAAHPAIPADVAQWMKMPAVAPEPTPKESIPQPPLSIPPPHGSDRQGAGLALPSAPAARNPLPCGRDYCPDVAPTNRGRFAVELGAAMIYHFDDNPPNLGPELRLSYRATPSWILALDVVGPAFTWPRARSAGDLTPREELAVAEIAFAPRLAGPIAPLLSLGLGADHTHLFATAVAPYVANSADLLSFVTTAGAAAQIEITPRVALHLGARALFAFPGSIYRIAGEDVGRIGRVNLITSLGVVFTP
jgi:hypothetical protein